MCIRFRECFAFVLAFASTFSHTLRFAFALQSNQMIEMFNVSFVKGVCVYISWFNFNSSKMCVK